MWPSLSASYRSSLRCQPFQRSGNACDFHMSSVRPGFTSHLGTLCVTPVRKAERQRFAPGTPVSTHLLLTHSAKSSRSGSTFPLNQPTNHVSITLNASLTSFKYGTWFFFFNVHVKLLCKLLHTKSTNYSTRRVYTFLAPWVSIAVTLDPLPAHHRDGKHLVGLHREQL